MPENWVADIREPFVSVRSLEQVPPFIWTDERVIQCCKEIQDSVPSLSRNVSFPATNHTTILPDGTVRDDTFFEMRHAQLADPALFASLPVSIANLVVNYPGIIEAIASDAAVATNLSAGLGAVSLPNTNHRRVEAFVTNPELGETSDWHTDERLTVPFYPKRARMLVSWLRNARTLEDILSQPMTEVIIDYGQFVIFDGVNHPHKGFSFLKGEHGDRVVLGFLYDMVQRKPEGPGIDNLLKV